MIVECSTCPVRGLRCDGCVLTALEALPAPETDLGLPLDAGQRRAVQLFVDAGLVRAEQARSVRAQAQPGRWRASG